MLENVITMFKPKVNLPEPDLAHSFQTLKSIPSNFTFQRSTIGTYIGADQLLKTAAANSPRFHHNPLTGICEGLLIEPATTNYFLNNRLSSLPSASGDNRHVVTTNCSAVLDSTVAWLDGQRCLRLSSNDGQPYTLSYKSTTIKPNQTIVCFSIYIKTNGSGEIGLRLVSNTSVYASADFNHSADGELQRSAMTAVSTVVDSDYRLEKVSADGWYRISLYAFSGSTSTTPTLTVQLVSAETLCVAAAQLEDASSMTSWISTTTPAVTRSADVFQIAAAAASNFIGPNSSVSLVADYVNKTAPAMSHFSAISLYSSSSLRVRAYSLRHQTDDRRYIMVGGRLNDTTTQNTYLAADIDREQWEGLSRYRVAMTLSANSKAAIAFNGKKYGQYPKAGNFITGNTSFFFGAYNSNVQNIKMSMVETTEAVINGCLRSIEIYSTTVNKRQLLKMSEIEPEGRTDELKRAMSDITWLV